MASFAGLLEGRCRLCLSDHAVDLLRMKRKDKMVDIISISTTILADVLLLEPLKFCEKCCLLILKLYAYRRITTENNYQLLKELFAKCDYRNEQIRSSSDGKIAALCKERNTSTAKDKNKQRNLPETKNAIQKIYFDKHEQEFHLNENCNSKSRQIIPTVSVNATFSTEEEQDLNKSEGNKLSRSRKQSVAVNILPILKRNFENADKRIKKVRFCKTDHGDKYHNVDLMNKKTFVKIRKHNFLSALGLVRMSKTAASQLDASRQRETVRRIQFLRLLEKSKHLVKSRRKRSRKRRFCFNRKKKRSDSKSKVRSGCIVHSRALRENLPIVKLTRLDECKDLKEKYFAQISKIERAKRQ